MSLLAFLGTPWGLVAHGRAEFYRRGVLATQRLRQPTICIGALEMGGTGKTPVVAAVTQVLQRAGRKPAVISRGYSRRDRRPSVVSDGRGLCIDVQSAGDEPAWYARSLDGVPVAVAARREEAAELLEQRALQTDVYILDDAFQHLRVARDVNLLVVDATRPFWEQAPPPGGRLREGAGAARRADAFILVVNEQASRHARNDLASRYPDRPTFEVRSSDPGYWPLDTWDPRTPPEATTKLGASCAAFAGIARPQRFFRMLEAHGIDVRARRTFPDHHWYSDRDLTSLRRMATGAGATALVTTEKDAVRLQHLKQPQVPRIHVWSYRLSLTRPLEFEAWLLSRIAAIPDMRQ